MSSKGKKDQKMDLKENKKEDEKKTDLGSLEEDDDFEEFPVEGLFVFLFCLYYYLLYISFFENLWSGVMSEIIIIKML